MVTRRPPDESSVNLSQVLGRNPPPLTTPTTAAPREGLDPTAVAEEEAVEESSNCLAVLAACFSRILSCAGVGSTVPSGGSKGGTGGGRIMIDDGEE